MRLEGCYERLERVSDQLDEMKLAVADFHAKQPFSISWKEDAEGWRILRFHQSLPIPPRWGVIVGELLYNLRATLNEAVTDLVEANGRRAKGTSFPIYVTRTGPDGYFTPRGKKKISPRDDYLAGLTDPQKALVDGFQPFDWPSDPLARLAGITNIDKHERVQVALTWNHEGVHIIEPDDPSTVAHMEIGVQTTDEALYDGAVLLRARSQPPGPMKVQGGLQFHEAFGAQRVNFADIVEMQKRVVEIIERFQSEFAPRPPAHGATSSE